MYVHHILYMDIIYVYILCDRYPHFMYIYIYICMYSLCMNRYAHMLRYVIYGYGASLQNWLAPRPMELPRLDEAEAMLLKWPCNDSVQPGLGT